MRKLLIAGILLVAGLANSADVLLGRIGDLTFSGTAPNFVASFGGAPAPVGWADTNAPIAMWEMNETNATATLDTSQYAAGSDLGLDATNKPNVGSGPTRIIAGTNENGRVEYGYLLNGSTTYFEVDNAFIPAVSNNAVGSINIWLKRTDVNDASQAMFSLSNAGKVSYLMFDINSSDFRVFIKADGGIVGQQTTTGDQADVAVGTNCMVTYVQDGGSYQKIYVNGQPVPQTTTANTTWLSSVTGDASSPATVAAIGVVDDGSPERYFDGTIFEIDYYDYPLSTNQIAELYQYTNPTNQLRIRE